MDPTAWSLIVDAVRRHHVRPLHQRYDHSDADVVLTALWAARHTRPISWACRRENWPLGLRRSPRPSCSCMSRRLRTASVRALFHAVEADLRGSTEGVLVQAVDGKCLHVSAHSQDRTATFSGRGLRGYKLHAMCDLTGRITSWRVTPMHCHEAVIAGRLLAASPPVGYVLADANYDQAELHGRCASLGAQLITPRRTMHIGRGVRHKGVPASRLRSIQMIEQSQTGFGPKLLQQRQVVERVFARLEQRHAIGRVPIWIRGLARVRQWIQAAIILDQAAQLTKHGRKIAG